MEEVIEKVLELREKCLIYQNELEKKLGDRLVYNDPRNSCFGRISNGTIITLELLNYYKSKLPQNYPDTNEEDNKIEDAIGDRFMKILRMFFIDSLSSIEYSIKNSISLYPENGLNKVLIKQKRCSYLDAIIDESKSIIPDDIDIWRSIIEMRNLIIHNNCIPDKDVELNFDERVLKMKKGEMMSGEPDLFLFLTLKSIDLYFDWINKLIDKY